MKKILYLLLFFLLNFSLAMSQETVEELNKKGLELYDKGKYEEAITCFDKALKMSEDSYQIWNNKGLAYYKLKKYEEAIKYFEKALSINPNYITGWYNKGSALYMMKNYNAAIVCFDKVLALDPKHSGAKSKKAQAQAALENQKSIKSFIDKGMASYNQGKYDDAINYYGNVLALDSANEAALVGTGNSLFAEKKYDEAITYYDKALKINPKNTEALYGKGNVLFAQGKYKEAIEYYNKILAIKPDDSNGKTKKEEAEKSLAAQQTPSAEKLFQQGEVFFNEKNFDEALKYYNKALAVDQNHVPSLFKKGNILAKAGTYDKALECFNNVLKLKPDFPDIQVKIQEMEKALAGQAVPVDSQACKDLYDKGTVLYKDGKFEEALKNFQQSLDINPQYVPALFKKGLTISLMSYGKDKRKIKEALECFTSVNKLDPDLKQCDINGTDNHGTTPLQIALMKKAMVIAGLPDLFIDKGADVNVKNNDGNTALHEAARFGYLEIASKLLDKGADVNVKNSDGFTPLHSASASGFVKVAELLIEKGANVNAKSRDGRTPLGVAGTYQMKELLRAKGAKE